MNGDLVQCQRGLFSDRFRIRVIGFCAWEAYITCMRATSPRSAFRNDPKRKVLMDRYTVLLEEGVYHTCFSWLEMALEYWSLVNIGIVADLGVNHALLLLQNKTHKFRHRQ